MADSSSSKAALMDFVEQWTEDARSGEPRPLQDYLERFPGHEQAIAREYLRLTEGSALSVDVEPTTTGSSALEGLIERLRAPRRTEQRYARSGELARGGMGSILRARDVDLRRDVAMKVMIGRGPRRTARFLEEAQVTGQLEHPGVVPIHDLGVDQDGRVFFTMRLVEGLDLREVIERSGAGDAGWSLTRALEVLLKVCDTVAYAHARGIVHRDLKPSNVRVGSFGEVYVMDWGLARVIGGPASSELAVDSDRAEERASERESPLLTREGDVIGTPSYMAPEQAEGRAQAAGPEADVYAVGAMLYHVLAGAPPYASDGGAPSSETVLAAVRRGPPDARPLREHRTPPELVAICEMSMARDPLRRYPSLREMAEDLRAFLEGRVVRAHRTGAWVELWKWVARNRALSTSLAGALLVALGLLGLIAVQSARSRARLQLLADAGAPNALLARIREIAPSGPAEVEPLAAWLTEARELVSRRDAYAREHADLRANALPFDPAQPREIAARRSTLERIEYLRRVRDFYRTELARLDREGGLSNELMTREAVQEKLSSFEVNLARSESAPVERLAWTFADAEDQLRFDTLEALLPALSAFLDSSGTDGWITRAERRLAFARTVDALTLVDARTAWNAAVASVHGLPIYTGLVLRPQIGLLPLRRDPASGLWEFLHVQSGSAPAADSRGRWRMTEETGIVLVLIPGGDFAMGAQREDPNAANYDPQAEIDESGRYEGRRIAFPGFLEPFFLSKYEITQAQWRRIAGRDSSWLTPSSAPNDVRSAIHPAERVDWSSACDVLAEVGLKLPSEARWEFAARAGGSTPWPTGPTRDSLRGAANLADARSAGSQHVDPRDREDWPELDDGYAAHAPVGSLRENAFGLHDVCGNLAEWCSDTGFVSYDRWSECRFGDLERRNSSEGIRVRRGGSYASRASALRSAARAYAGPQDARVDTGVRPARDLDR